MDFFFDDTSAHLNEYPAGLHVPIDLQTQPEVIDFVHAVSEYLTTPTAPILLDLDDVHQFQFYTNYGHPGMWKTTHPSASECRQIFFVMAWSEETQVYAALSFKKTEAFWQLFGISVRVAASIDHM